MTSNTPAGRLPLLPEYANVVVKPRARDYLVDGVKYQRVTTALSIINKPALIPWAKRVALAKVSDVLLAPDVQSELVTAIEETPAAYEAFVERIIERAAKAPDEARDERGASGTETHRLIQECVGLTDVSEYLKLVGDEHRPAVWEALNFLADFDIDVCDTERVVWEPSTQVAGTIDGVGFRNGRLVIWDWKTGAGIYWEAALQLGAYAHLLTNLTGRAVEEAYAVKLPRAGDEGGYEARRLTAGGLAKAWEHYYSTLVVNRGSKLDWWEESNDGTN